MHRSLSVALSAALLAGCSGLDHTNPFDPSTPASQQARATLVGTVTKEAGATAPVLSGVRVSIPGSSLGADTDAAGHFSISDVPPGTYALQAVATGYDSATVTGIAVTLDDGDREVEVPTLSLALSRGAVSGFVSAEAFGAVDAMMLSGALVSLDGLPGAATTDAAGGFFLSGVPAGQYTLSVKRVGFVQGGNPLSVTVAGNAVATLPSVPVAWDPGGVSGSLLVQGAATSGGVTVRVKGLTLVGTPFQATTTSAPDGTWGLEGAVPAGDYNVTYELTDYAVVAASTTVAPHTTTALPAVTLVRDTGSVTGVATLQGTGDASGIQVTLSPQGTATVAGAAITDGAGVWAVNALPVGLYDVAYQKTGYLKQAATVLVLSNRSVAVAAASLPVIPGVLRGRVLLEGVAAGAWQGTTVSIVGATGLSTTTGTDGKWVLSGVGSGALQVAIDHPGFDAQTIQVVTSPGGDLTLLDVSLAVSRGGLAGTVTLQGAASSAGVVVTAAGPARQSTVTDATGAFSLAGLPVGTYAVSARLDPDYAPLTVAGQVVAAGATTTLSGSPRTLSLLTTGSIGGTAAVERGSAAGIAVALSGVDRNGALVTQGVQTAAGGAYALPSLPNGSYSLTFTKAGYDPVTSSGLTVTGGAVTAPAVTLLAAKGTIAGQVSLTAGAVTGFSVGSDFSGAVVSLTGADVPVPSAVTDPSGNYRFPDVPVSLAGTPFTVTARKPNFTTASTTVTGVANATVSVTALTLPVNAGSLAGTAVLWDDVGNAGQNATSAGITVQVSGATFNGTSWTVTPAPTTAANGAWSVPAIPPGTYTVTLTSASRTCAAGGSASVTEGAPATIAGAVRCQDAIAPGTVVLTAPAPYTTSTSVPVTIASAAADATTPSSNFRGYQLAVGAAPDWSAATITAGQPGALTFTLPAVDGAYTLWARAVDWIGNAGPAASAAVTLDRAAPTTPTLSTPRGQVNDTTAAVTVTGSEGDPAFLQYEACVGTAVGACPASPSCSPLLATPSSFAAPLTADKRNCVWARARDKAGNTSGAAVLEIVSDLTPPTPPTVVPTFDPLAVGLRATYADFFVTGGPTDKPMGDPTPWLNVAWLEVDSGAGFVPLCPEAACHPANTYQPCAAACTAVCTDARRVCGGTAGNAPYAIRVPLAASSANVVSVRAVDVAGNVGSAFSQTVNTLGQGGVLASGGNAYLDNVRIKGSVVTWSGAGGVWLTDLGQNLRPEATDPACIVGAGSGGEIGAEPASQSLVVLVDGATNFIRARRRGTGPWCSGTDATTSIYTIPAGYTVGDVSAAGERAAFIRRTNATSTYELQVIEPGASGQLGVGPVAGPFLAATYASPALPLQMQLGGKYAITWVWLGGSNYAWYLVTANGSDFSGGATSQALPAGTWGAAVSADGSEIVYAAQSGINETLTVCRPGAAGAYTPGGAGCVTRSYPLGAINTTGSRIAIEGTHVVAVENGSPGYVTDWNAGPDGVFQASGGDDTLVRNLPSTVTRASPSIGSNGLLVYRNGYSQTDGTQDLLWLDLSSLRWEVAAAGELRYPVVNGAGALFAADLGSSRLVYRSGDGRTTAASTVNGYSTPDWSYAAATGNALVTNDAYGLWVYLADPGGGWFATVPTPTKVYTAGAGNNTYFLTAGGGKALALELVSSTWVPIVLEPGAGTLATATAVNVLAGAGITASGSNAAFAITSQYAFFSCVSSGTRLCVREAGADHVFGTADDAGGTVVLKHAPNAAIGVAGTPFDGSDAQAWGRKVAVTSGGHLYVLDAGPDLHFNTADDAEVDLGTFSGDRRDFALAGNFVAYLAVGAPAGKQVFLVDLVTNSGRQLTEHYSVKQQVVVEPSGRVFWKDGLFASAGIFTRTP
ncbi:MAG: carboxypeptidase regulatory-like domain-containing protein [Anaeromyxobacteraceae bacterium]